MSQSRYDYLIVGSGITGAVFAYEATERGKKCLVVEQRDHVGGNIYDTNVEGILVHRYGAHIFHTRHKEIWDYLNQFSAFNQYVNTPIANYKGEIYNLPFNMNTFNRLWGVITPEQAQEKIAGERLTLSREPVNLEEQALCLVGAELYEKLIRGYTEKQWGRSCKELPPFIIKRIPLRFTYDNNYFNDKYQGIPLDGYTHIVELMLKDCETQTGVDYLADKAKLDTLAPRIIYTGMIDRYFDFCFGPLEYRSLRFEDTHYDMPNYQGVAVMNFTDGETPYTRCIEHKHFLFGNQPDTIVTREYPVEWSVEKEPYYPVNDFKNQCLYNKYHEMAQREPKVVFCGRLGEYRYYDMDQAIIAALKKVTEEMK